MVVRLTKRQREVLRHVALGESNKQIANALSISYQTTKNHVGNIMIRLGAHNRVDLTRLYWTQVTRSPNLLVRILEKIFGLIPQSQVYESRRKGG